MKATEIVEKLRNVLLSSNEENLASEELSQEEVNEIEVTEAEEVNLEEEVQEEQPVQEEEMKYATKEELESAMAEVRAMYDELMSKVSGEDEMEKDVPAELSEEVEEAEELSKEDLSAQEPAEPITHSPESEEKQKLSFFSGNKPRNTMSVVYEKMFNK